MIAPDPAITSTDVARLRAFLGVIYGALRKEDPVVWLIADRIFADPLDPGLVAPRDDDGWIEGAWLGEQVRAAKASLDRIALRLLEGDEQ